MSGSAGHKHGSAGLRAALPLGNLIYFAVEFLQIPYSPPSRRTRSLHKPTLNLAPKP